MSLKVRNITVNELFKAGAYWGHSTSDWNPKVAPNLYGKYDKIYIIDLNKTLKMLEKALRFLRESVLRGAKVLFVGTKRQAAEAVTEAAVCSAQYYVNYVWKGGMLTNWTTFAKSFQVMEQLAEELTSLKDLCTKKELLSKRRSLEKMKLSLDGVVDMNGLPDILIVVDPKKEEVAVNEAIKCKIPVIALIDTDGDPDKVDYPIFTNDENPEAIRLILSAMRDEILDALEDRVALRNPKLEGAKSHMQDNAEKDYQRSINSSLNNN